MAVVAATVVVDGMGVAAVAAVVAAVVSLAAVVAFVDVWWML